MTPSDMPPDNPQTPAYKAAKLAVIILSVLIVLAVIALVGGGIAKVSGKPKAGTPSTFTLAPGAKILALESQPGRLILRIRTETGEEIDIIDTTDGHLVGQVKANFSK